MGVGQPWSQDGVVSSYLHHASTQVAEFLRG